MKKTMLTFDVDKTTANTHLI